MQKVSYRFFRFWVMLAVKLFYRRIEIHGSENYPITGPVLLAPNHQNAFMDALIPSVLAKRPVHFLVRADVFKSPFLSWFFTSVNMMPVYRQRDGMANLTKNDDIFERCFSILRNGGVLLIFPEASHLGGRQLRNLSKGFARIVFGALEHHEHLDIKVLPVGLNYSNYSESQSRMLMNYGQPLRVNDYHESYKANPPKAMADLKADLQQRLEAEIVHIEREDALKAFDIEMERLLPFYLQRTTGFSKPTAQHYFYKSREKSIQKLPENDPYFTRLSIYDLEMARYKLQAPFFFIEEKDGGFWVVQNIMLLLALPFFLAAWIIHAPTYITISNILRRFVKDKQFHSSIKLVGTLILFPLFGLIFAVVAAIWSGRPMLTAAAVLAFFPLSVFVIRELRLPYRYTITMWRMLFLRFRKPDLYKYLKSIEQDALMGCKSGIK